MRVIILAAGYATRLHPITRHQPKALLSVGGRQMVDHLMDRVDAVPNVEEIVLVTNSRFFGQFSQWSANRSQVNPKAKRVRVLDDGTTSNADRLGATGDLRFALREARISDDLIVLASDNLFDEDLTNFAAKLLEQDGGVLIGMTDIGDPKLAAGRYGTIETSADGEVTAIEEKPAEPKTSRVSMGVYGLSRRVLPFLDDYLSGKEVKDAPGHFIKWLLDHVEVRAYEFKGRWYDIGSFDQWAEADKALLKDSSAN
ncbi:MAG: nucleotidyltransferase family protein [Candidatus Omnitrophica bacterium]|jgi:glucose-1-phosphate thymidylyltransferase|nr:nucleotidyltransferase family protein [Candidatus Omnitrophota bacterium]